MNLVFFTDRDLGIQFPAILEAHGVSVERHRDHFRPDCPDEEWLEVVGSRGWIAITHDGRIRYKPNELNAVIRHQVTLLIVIGNAPYPELARSFVATISRITEFVALNPPPLIAKVYRPSPAVMAERPTAPGRIELSFPRAQK